MTDIVQDPEHSDGAPTINDTGIRAINVASAYSPDEIVGFHPVLTLEDVHTALAYYYAHIGGFGDIEPESDAAPA